MLFQLNHCHRGPCKGITEPIYAVLYKSLSLRNIYVNEVNGKLDWNILHSLVFTFSLPTFPGIDKWSNGASIHNNYSNFYFRNYLMENVIMNSNRKTSSTIFILLRIVISLIFRIQVLFGKTFTSLTMKTQLSLRKSPSSYIIISLE